MDRTYGRQIRIRPLAKGTKEYAGKGTCLEEKEVSTGIKSCREGITDGGVACGGTWYSEFRFGDAASCFPRRIGATRSSHRLRVIYSQRIRNWSDVWRYVSSQRSEGPARTEVQKETVSA